MGGIVFSIEVPHGFSPILKWHFNGEDDATRCGRKGPDSAPALAKILSDLYKREEEEFIRIKPRDGFSMYNPPSWVSGYILFQSFPHSLA